MTIAAIISLLISVAEAIPALSGLCTFLITKLEAYDTAKNTSTSASRLAEKDAAVDAAIDAANRMSISSTVKQQSTTNAASSIQSSSDKRS